MDDPIPLIDPSGGVPVEFLPDNPDAAPVLDDWGWDDHWHAADWMTWYTAMLNTYGYQHAQQNFRYYWGQQSWGAEPIKATFLDADFIQFLRANGLIDLQSPTQKVVRNIIEAPDTLATGANALFDAAKAAANTAKALSWLVPVGLLVFVFGKYLAEPSQKIKRLVA